MPPGNSMLHEACQFRRHLARIVKHPTAGGARMSWPEVDLVVGNSLTDNDLRRVDDAAAIGAAVLAAAGTCTAEVEGFEELQRERPTLQQKAHWCWAACVQTVLRHYG